ncbi:MAG: PfkB family carbohydrate kinase, partial [Clostridia bacterium]
SIMCYPAKVVDTTAAGDTFIGTFAAMMAIGKEAQEALNIASKAAALTVSRKGAQQSIPYIYEIQ